MKFIVSSTGLFSRLQAISRVINSKNSLPILDCFLMDVQENGLSITIFAALFFPIPGREATEVIGSLFMSKPYSYPVMDLIPQSVMNISYVFPSSKRYGTPTNNGYDPSCLPKVMFPS